MDIKPIIIDFDAPHAPVTCCLCGGPLENCGCPTRLMKMGTVRVVSKRVGGVVAAADEYIIPGDRASRVLGNRHILRDPDNDEERAKVILAWQADLAYDWSVNGPIKRKVLELAARVRGGDVIALQCWCAPRPCHLDTVAKMVRWYAENQRKVSEV